MCSCQRILTTRRAQGWCRPRSKRQAGFEKEDQDLVSALATANCASCCPCAQRRFGIRDRDRPLPSSQPLAHSLGGRTTRSRLADAEAGRIPWVGFYGDRICGTSSSNRLLRCFPKSTRIDSVLHDDEECSAPVEPAPASCQIKISMIGGKSGPSAEIERANKECCSYGDRTEI